MRAEQEVAMRRSILTAATGGAAYVQRRPETRRPNGRSPSRSRATFGVNTRLRLRLVIRPGPTGSCASRWMDRASVPPLARDTGP